MRRRGQSLVEILVAVAVGAIIVASAAAALVTIVRSNQVSLATNTASSLAQELMDNIRSYGEANWQDLYAATSKGNTTQTCPPYCYNLGSTVSIAISTVNGTEFVSGATVKLTKAGQADISCTGFTFVNPTTLSNGTCPISGAATGAWNVVVTNPDAQTGTSAGAFTIY